jgi:hypothetical protein
MTEADALATVPEDPPAAGPDRALDPPLAGADRAVARGKEVVVGVGVAEPWPAVTPTMP